MGLFEREGTNGPMTSFYAASIGWTLGLPLWWSPEVRNEATAWARSLEFTGRNGFAAP